jgi:hypothetical protein
VAMWRPVVLYVVSITSYNDGGMIGSAMAVVFGCLGVKLVSGVI